MAAIVLFVLIAGMGGAVPAYGAENPDMRAERFDGLIEGLNASSAGRTRALEMIYNELRGPDGREMQEMLREALSRQNTLILLGVVEAMAMLGDSRDVSSLDALLATTDKLEVKSQVMRLLPAFCLHTERSRINYINYAAGYSRVSGKDVLEPLRRPPLTRRGRLDASLERLQGRVVRSVAAQFDPVGAALRYLDDVIFGAAARRAVVHFVANSLGNDPTRWARIWAAQGDDMTVLMPDEVEEIRLTALMALADMGAEGLPEVIAAFEIPLASESEILRQATFETMAVMCRTGFQGYDALASMNFSVEDAVEGENWRKRRYASNARLAVYAAESASRVLIGEMDNAVFIAAADCLGAALSYPDAFPDPDGALLDARRRGGVFLEQLLMRPDIEREKRASVAKALGEIGTLRSVSALQSIIASPYCLPEAGIDGTRMAESVVDALRNVAVGPHEGNGEAKKMLLNLMNDSRVFPPLRPQTPPVGLSHMVLWRLQRLTRSTDINMDPEVWRQRLNW